MIDMTIKSNVKVKDAVANYIDAAYHFESCYEVIVDGTKENPYLLDLVDALVVHTQRKSQAEHELAESGIADAFTFCAQHN